MASSEIVVSILIEAVSDEVSFVLSFWEKSDSSTVDKGMEPFAKTPLVINKRQMKTQKIKELFCKGFMLFLTSKAWLGKGFKAN